MNKPLPPAKFKQIRPPNENYTYFEDKELHPFLPRATAFELVNAGWLADFALLAYGDEGLIRKCFKQSGLTDAGFDFKFFSKQTTQCFVAHNGEFVVVSLRGTEIDNFRGALTDWLRNFELLPVSDDSGGRVHEGFKRDIKAVWQQLKDHLQPLLDSGTRTLWITGHSLGAALATLAAERAARDGRFAVQGVYTYGSPRLGDDGFKQAYATRGLDARTFRFVNNVDVVPKLPPVDLYKHVGQLKFIDRDGHLHLDTADEADAAEPDLLKRLSGKGRALLENLFGLTIPAPFANHAPIYYATRIWNNMP
jgi:pimeloyl-ACP methyl ester carboxylesterase